MNSAPETWFLLRSAPGPAAENMALDEALSQHAAAAGSPLLRVYGWSEPAATFGYFQKYKQVAALTNLRPLIRRPTGGGLVPHDADWTYSLVFPQGHWWYDLSALESYRQAHEWIRAAFARLGVTSELSQLKQLQSAGQCFARPEQFDLVGLGRKLAGAAQRRSKRALLIQGSIQPPPGPARVDWIQSFCDAARERWGVTWTDFKPDASLQACAAELTSKYRAPEYNQKR